MMCVRVCVCVCRQFLDKSSEGSMASSRRCCLLTFVLCCFAFCLYLTVPANPVPRPVLRQPLYVTWRLNTYKGFGNQKLLVVFARHLAELTGWTMVPPKFTFKCNKRLRHTHTDA